MKKILVSGSIAYDHIMNFPDLFKNHFIADKLHNINVSFNVENHTEHFGGTGGNIAYNLSLLGESPTLIGTAGNDFEKYRTRLEAQHIDLSLVQIDETKASSFAYILTDKGDNQISAFYPGAGGNTFEMPIPPADLAIVGPSNPVDMERLPVAFKQQNIPYFFDPGQVTSALSAQVLRDGIEHSEVVFGNDYEFSAMCKCTGWSETDMMERGKTFIVTLGALGTRVLEPNGGYKVESVKTTSAIDPTGAGDAYRAGYAKGFLAGLPIEQCVKLASCAGVYAVEKQGTQNHFYTMDEFRTRYQENYSEKCPV